MSTILKQTPTLTLTMSDKVVKEEVDFISQQIKKFNNQVSVHHRAIRPVGPRPLNVFAHNARQEIVGGLTGATFWGWLSVDDFWLSETLRGQGLGREMLLAGRMQANTHHAIHTTASTGDHPVRRSQPHQSSIYRGGSYANPTNCAFCRDWPEPRPYLRPD